MNFNGSLAQLIASPRGQFRMCQRKEFLAADAADIADAPGINMLSERVIGCAFEVLNTLGPGFLEKVYENALAHEWGKYGLTVVQQHGVEVHYDGIVVGQQAVDLLVEATVVVELKAIRAPDDAHAAQCIHYLRATGLRLCLLLNFGKPRLEILRFANGL